MSNTRGMTLVELLVILAILGLAAAIGTAKLVAVSSRSAVALAAEEIRSGMHQTRAEAIRFNANAALRFEESPNGPVCRLYRDGNGDGVLTRDINAGIDRPVGPPRVLGRPGLGIHYGFPPDVQPRDPSSPSRRLDRLHDPIRFNNSNMASFDPFGGATPGSVYLTDGREVLMVVRIFGRTGRIRVLVWDQDLDAWRER